MTASPEPKSALTAGSTSAGPVYFIADAHLGCEPEPVERAKSGDLVAFLSHLRGRASMLYLAGDLFDFWFEYPSVEPRDHLDILRALSELTQAGTRVRFLGGNHDYWAGRQFSRITGAEVYRKPVSDTHHGRRIFVAHGDGLPKGDGGYKFLKGILRSRVSIALFTLLGPSIGHALARWASGLSEITEERIQAAVPSMKEFLEDTLSAGYDAVLVGHVHMQLFWKSGDGDAIVIGDWMQNRSVVELTESGFRFLAWKDGSLVEAQANADASPNETGGPA